MELQPRIEELFAREADTYGDECLQVFDEFKAALNEGRIRAAEPDANAPNGWKVNPWVKKGILLGFRIGKIVAMPTLKSETVAIGIESQFRDKHTFPLKKIPASQNVRVVPGGSAIRDGCYIGKDVVCMPPMYVN